jgi:serine/threonine-protein kinase
MALEAGREIERYRVVRLLGEGGMAQVYLVRHTSLDTEHALKVLTLTGPTLKDRLKHEGKVQAQLRHENIVRVSDVLDVPPRLHDEPALEEDRAQGMLHARPRRHR